MFVFERRSRKKLARACNAAVALLSSTSILIGSVTQSYAQGMLIGDPSAPGTGFLQTSNGTPQIDIATPQSGVSVNKFSEFNVGPEGLVLNNSTVSGVSVIGQNVTANPNLVSGPADTIVNEVTSAAPSSLQGPTEVFGQTAAVIIANPNGISCNGCSFLNSSSSILTTGTPIVDGPDVDLQVTEGTITVGPNGFSAGQQGGIYARHVILDGEVSTDQQSSDHQLVVSGGAQRVQTIDFDALAQTSVVAAPSVVAKTSPFAIDATQNGALTSGEVHVLGMETDQGVNLYGNVDANSFQASSGGGLFYKDVLVTNNVVLSGQDIRQYGELSAGGDVTINGDSFTLYDGRTLRAGVGETGSQQATVTINADNYAVIAGEISSSEITIDVATGSLTNNGFLLADGELMVFAGEDIRQQREIATEYDVYYDPALQNYLDAYYEQLLNGGDEADLAAEMIARAEAHEIIAQYIDDGATAVGTNVWLHAVTGDLTNTGGAISATNDIILTAGADIINSALTLTTQIGATEDCTSGNCGTRMDYHPGEMLAGNLLDLYATGSIENRASDMAAAGDVVLTSGQDIIISLRGTEHSYDLVEGERDITLSGAAGSYSDSDTVLAPARMVSLYGDISIDTGRDLIIQGSDLSAGDAIDLDAAGEMTLAGFIDTEQHFVDEAHFETMSSCPEGDETACEIVSAVNPATGASHILGAAPVSLVANSISITSEADLTAIGTRFLAATDLDLKSNLGSIIVDAASAQSASDAPRANSIDLVKLDEDVAGQLFQPVDYDVQSATQEQQDAFNSNARDYLSLLNDNKLLTAVEALRRADSGADIADAARSVGVQSFVSLVDDSMLESLKADTEAAIGGIQDTFDTQVTTLNQSISSYHIQTRGKIAELTALLTAPDATVEAAMLVALDQVQLDYSLAIDTAQQAYDDDVAAIKAQHNPYLTYWWLLNGPAIYASHQNLKASKLQQAEDTLNAALDDAETQRQLDDLEVRASFTETGIEGQIAAVQTSYSHQMAAYASEKGTLFADIATQIAHASDKLQQLFDQQVLFEKMRAQLIAQGSVTSGASGLADALSEQEFGETSANSAMAVLKTAMSEVRADYDAAMLSQHETYLARIAHIDNTNAQDKEAQKDQAQADYMAGIAAVETERQLREARALALQADANGIVSHKDTRNVSGTTLDQLQTDFDAAVATYQQQLDDELASISAQHDPYLTPYWFMNAPVLYVSYANSKARNVAIAHAKFLAASQTAETNWRLASAQEADRLADLMGDSDPDTGESLISNLISASKEDQDAFLSATAWRLAARQATENTPGGLLDTLYANDDMTMSATGNLHVANANVEASDELALNSFANMTLARGTTRANSLNVIAAGSLVAQGVDLDIAADANIFTGANTVIGSIGTQTNPVLGQTFIFQDPATLAIGNDLSIDALGDIQLAGLNAQVDRDIILTAGQDLDIYAAPEITKLFLTNFADVIEFYTLVPHLAELSAGRDFTALAGDSARIEGAQIDAANALKVAATNNVTLSAAQDVYDHETRAADGDLWAITKVRNIGTRLTSGGDLDVEAETGDLITAGTRFESTAGNVNLSATQGNILAGTYTDLDSYRIVEKSSKLGGLISSVEEYQLNTRIATGTEALSALDLSLVSGEDTTLIGATLSAGGDLNLDVGGNLNVLAAISSVEENFYSNKLGAVFATTETRESYKETAIYTTFEADGSLNFNVGGETILSLYSYADEDAPNAADIYPEELRALAGVVLLNEELLDEYFEESTKSLSPAFVTVLTIALTAGYSNIIGAASTSLSPATASSISAFAASSTVGLLNGAVSGEMDLGEILKDAAFAAATSFLTASINLKADGKLTKAAEAAEKAGEATKVAETINLLGDGAWGKTFNASIFGENLTLANVLEDALDSTISSGLSSAVYGTDFKDGLTNGLIRSVVTLGMADVHKEIGGLFRDANGDPINGGEGSLGHVILHGIAGCAAAEATGADCAAGAAGGIAQALYVGQLKSDAPNPVTDPVAYNAWRSRIAGSAEIIGLFAGFAFSGGDPENVSTASLIARSGAENNYLTHEQWGILLDNLKNCPSEAECLGYLEDAQTTSETQSAELRSCIDNNDTECLIRIRDDLLELQRYMVQHGLEFGKITNSLLPDDSIVYVKELAGLDSADIENFRIFHNQMPLNLETYDQFVSTGFCDAISASDCRSHYSELVSNGLNESLTEAGALVVDLVPGLGDLKGAVDCANDLSFSTCAGAVAGLVPLLGDGAQLLLRHGDDVVVVSRNGDEFVYDSPSAEQWQALADNHEALDNGGNGLWDDLGNHWNATKGITKPTGVPDTWISKPTNKGGGTRYSNPDNPHDFVRVMPGNPNSPNPAQQQPYVIRSQNGRIVDVNGNPVASNDPAAHIPLSDFEF